MSNLFINGLIIHTLSIDGKVFYPSVTVKDLPVLSSRDLANHYRSKFFNSIDFHPATRYSLGQLNNQARRSGVTLGLIGAQAGAIPAQSRLL
jgi:hypothetical protein